MNENRFESSFFFSVRDEVVNDGMYFFAFIGERTIEKGYCIPLGICSFGLWKLMQAKYVKKN